MHLYCNFIVNGPVGHDNCVGSDHDHHISDVILFLLRRLSVRVLRGEYPTIKRGGRELNPTGLLPAST